MLNIEATGDTFATRRTIEDMHNASSAPHNASNRWDLDYLKALGANWLWFQPVHPPYERGSHFVAKKFFAIRPIMSKNFRGDPFNNADLINQANRDAARRRGRISWRRIRRASV